MISQFVAIQSCVGFRRVRGASVSYKGQDIQSMCLEQVNIAYRTETWAMKAENLFSLERAERMMMARWMRGVSLNDFVSLLSVVDVVRRSRLRWFGHLSVRM